MNNDKDPKHILLMIVILSALLASFGQLLFKLGLIMQVDLFYLGAGILAYILSTFLFLYVISKVHLSWAYGVGGLSYVFASLLAFFVLSEQISSIRWIGIVIITMGVALVGLS